MTDRQSHLTTSSGICTGGRSGGFIVEFGVGIDVVPDALGTRNSFDRERFVSEDGPLSIFRNRLSAQISLDSGAFVLGFFVGAHEASQSDASRAFFRLRDLFSLLPDGPAVLPAELKYDSIGSSPDMDERGPMVPGGGGHTNEDAFRR